jgi:heptaprenyl diphosphate synthase
VSRALAELAERPGKMLRPGFVLLGARLKYARRNGRDGLSEALPEKIHRIAAAVEMLHMATLVHDDVMDDATERRGGAALHRANGARDAILMGDYLFSRCFSLVADVATMENARLLASGVAHICRGQIAETERRSEGLPSVRSYLRRITGKTALLFSLSFHVGASENGVRGGTTARLRRIGYNVGIAFQIIDDVLDLDGDDGALGKPTGTDLAQGIYTLPVVLGARRATNGFHELLDKAQDDEEARRHVIDELGSLGAIQEARRYAQRYTDRALREIALLPDSEVTQAIHGVTSALLQRSY